MGCAVSKDLAAAKRPRKVTKTVHGALKRVFYPLADGILRHKQVKSGEIPLEALGKESPKPEETGGNPEPPEVINVWELMEGLEDEDLELQGEEGIITAESLESRVEDVDDHDASVTDDHEEFESSSLSSPDLTTRNKLAGSPRSPRSPLCFDSPHKKSKRRQSSAAGLDVVVTRNFSFNLRSCMDQASTPKVILDSSSPLVKREDRNGGKEVSDPHRDSVDEFDSELLSTFESMLEQLSSESWVSGRTSCVENGRVDIQSSTSDVTLYFTRDDQECMTVTSILQSHGILVKKMDVSADPAWVLDHYVQVPALFIDGRYIGGAEQLLELKERDQLKLLLDGASRLARVCNGCCGARLVPCLDCNGSRRFFSDNGELEQCNECSEGGMVKCPLCSC